MNPHLKPALHLVALFFFPVLIVAQDGLPDGPTWGVPSGIVPTKANTLFATADGCAGCHSAGTNALALRDRTGADISPHGLWKASMMANAFRDPFWRAQVSREVSASPSNAHEIEALCSRCHAPMAHHTARIAGQESAPIKEQSEDALAVDGVSCTVCHQAQPENLGKKESFDGHLDIRPGRTIFGPYDAPLAFPMQRFSAFTPQKGAHIQESALCGSCHTLITRPSPDAEEFAEQTPYLEWRNSAFSTENPENKMGRSCQQCHMLNMGKVAIARNPGGSDFNIERRPNYRTHTFVGGSAQMLEILRDNAEELGVTASEASFDRMISMTRQHLKRKTARLDISDVERDGTKLSFDIRVTNLTGHKFPTGYPSRRVWLQVDVEVGDTLVFSSGAVDASGELDDVDDVANHGHVRIVREAWDVPVWEATPLDASGKPTTLLHQMARYGKDNRILPRGWNPEGASMKYMSPIGVGDDKNFIGGSDRVLYKLEIPEGLEGEPLVSARLLYQSVAPRWVDAHRAARTPESKQFVRMFDESNTLAEILVTATR